MQFDSSITSMVSKNSIRGGDQLFHISASLTKNCQSAALSVRISVCYLPIRNDVNPSIHKTFKSPYASGKPGLEIILVITLHFLSPLTQDMTCDKRLCDKNIIGGTYTCKSHVKQSKLNTDTLKVDGVTRAKMYFSSWYSWKKILKAYQWIHWLRHIQFTNKLTTLVG